MSPFSTIGLAIAVASLMSGAAGAKTVVVIIDKMKFAPVPELKLGDTIQWVNRDMFRHTATAEDKSFDVDLPPGASGKSTIRHPGVTRFFCRYHPGMKGVVAVGAKGR